MTSPVLRHIQLPVGPGTRLTVRIPRGHAMTGIRPLSEGDGFTIDVTGFSAGLGGGVWRTVLRSLAGDIDGITLELEVEGRYPE